MGNAVTVAKDLVQQGTFRIGVFQALMCQVTYRTLQEKGVECIAPSAARFYRVKALAKDNLGNWFRLTQSQG